MKRAIGLFLLLAVTMHVYGQARAKRWYERGMAAKAQHDCASALRAFKKAASIRTNYGDALLQIGWCYNEMTRYDNAVEALRLAILSNPLNPAVSHYELAHAFAGLRQYDSAIYHYGRAIAGGLTAYKERAYAFQEVGDCVHALADFKSYEALDDVDDSSTYSYRKGWCENEAGDHAAAVVSLNRCRMADPANAQCRMELGYAYYKLHRNSEALASYRAALQLPYAQEAGALFGIANVFFDNLSNFDSAAAYFARGLVHEPGNQEANYRLGWCYNERDRPADALRYLEKAVALDAGHMDARTELGYSLYKLSRYAEALVYLLPVAETNATDERSRYYAGLCYASMGDKDGLRKVRSELEGIHSDYAGELKKVAP